jgi:hypothetical protein
MRNEDILHVIVHLQRRNCCDFSPLSLRHRLDGMFVHSIALPQSYIRFEHLGYILWLIL